MKKQLLTLFISLFILVSIQAQKYTISGYVTDAGTKEKLIGANVFDLNTEKGAVCNNYGFYSITFNNKETIEFQVSYTGYLSTKKLIVTSKDTSINFMLQAGIEINEIHVSASKKRESGNIKINMEQVETLPSLTGEKDVLKIFILMPGVQSGGEASSELHVRGGSPDQNLILIDDVPVYYVNHLGGFVSIFDENAVNSINLIKGGFPARYGGRLSSVVDVRLKNGDTEKFGGEISLGLISSRLFLEGPLKKGKTSFIFSARRCNIDLYSRIFMLIAEDRATAGYTFYDINAKVNHKINENNQLSISLYTGRDRFFIKDKENILNAYGSVVALEKFKYNKRWGNTITALKWKKKWTPKLFGNITFAYTIFHYSNHTAIKDENSQTKDIIREYSNKFKSSVNDFILKSDFDYYLNSNNSIKFGIGGTYHRFNPGEIKYYLQAPDISTQDTAWGNKRIHSVEIYAYAEDEIKIGKRFSANIGIHTSGYNSDNNWFYSLQPRINAGFDITKRLTLTGSYSDMFQYIHLISSTEGGLPEDIWVPATKQAVPEKSRQFTAGLQYLYKKYKFTVEGYYKTLSNLVDFKNGASFFFIDQTWEDALEKNGKGTIYGIEFLAQKTKGKLTGWIAYTWSKNTRQFENINSGNEYPYNYDRRHDLAIVLNYKKSKRFNVSATWIYGSGMPLTIGGMRFGAYKNYPGYVKLLGSNKRPVWLPYTFENSYIFNKNNIRMPHYHRLDIAVNFTKQKKRGERTWSIGIYNVYNRKNAYFMYYQEDHKGINHFYKFTLFPILPSFSYSFKF